MSYYNIPRFCGIYYLPQSTSTSLPSWLLQVSLSTLSKIYDTAASTTLTQSFVNPSANTPISGAKYTFPLYESCAVTSFRCYIGKRLIEGVVKEKEDAKTQYDAAVARGETAGLLEQHTPDVFNTLLGNIPAGETVKVEIEYIMELKHDAEADGLRFTIPTSIAPRYGNAPSGVNIYNIPGAVEKGGMKISVQISMPSHIRAVNSPSHPISIHLGGHASTTPSPNDTFNPKRALASLSQQSTELGKDFPRALLESHPTLPDSKAFMVTLVPKFTLPTGPSPEIIFLADRSGSMEARIPALRPSLRLFLKSLPIGVKFNICSFGSTYSFLWTKSQPYTASSLAQAQRYVETMEADFGGTEILPAIESTVAQRYTDIPLEMMVLTDGEVWRPEELYAYIEEATANGDVRLFSLGIGQDVSHALVEGMARAGKGFAQIVADETEVLEGKVVRMLKAGLSAHINDYRLEWEGKPVVSKAEAEVAKTSSSSSSSQKINLCDTTANTDQPVTFSDLPEFIVPGVLQAPYKIPSLFPFSRTTAYVILAADVPAPSSVWLHGTSPSGDTLELEIAVQVVQEKGKTIHQLAARKILQELEQGSGYIHSGNYGVSQTANPGTFDEWVKREGVRVGMKYGIASKWTSFLAVAEGQNVQHVPMDEDAVRDDPGVIIRSRCFSPSSLTSPSPSPSPSPDPAPAGVRTKSKMGRGYTCSKRMLSVDSDSEDQFRERSKKMVKHKIGGGGRCQERFRRLPASYVQTTNIINLQTFEGYFSFDSTLAGLLGADFKTLQRKLGEISSGSGAGVGEELKQRLWATLLVVKMFERKLAGEKYMWELVVEKARGWMERLNGINFEEAEKVASEVVDEL